MNSQPIGFMDSGVGGLTVVKEILAQLPHESIIYFGDEARLPYGERDQLQIQQFAMQIAQFLLKRNIKLLVLACNTATAQALPYLTTHLSIPVIGVIDPGSRAAINTTRNNQIGVIATNGTVNSRAYETTLHHLAPAAQVFSLGCPRFIPMVEAGDTNTAVAQSVVTDDLKPILTHHIDTLVMGCTHYPLMRTLIQRAVGDQIKLVDPGIAVCDQVVATLRQLKMAAPLDQIADKQFFTTGSVTKFNQIATDWLQIKVAAHHVQLTELEEI